MFSLLITSIALGPIKFVLAIKSLPLIFFLPDSLIKESIAGFEDDRPVVNQQRRTNSLGECDG